MVSTAEVTVAIRVGGMGREHNKARLTVFQLHLCFCHTGQRALAFQQRGGQVRSSPSDKRREREAERTMPEGTAQRAAAASRKGAWRSANPEAYFCKRAKEAGMRANQWVVYLESSEDALIGG